MLEYYSLRMTPGCWNMRELKYIISSECISGIWCRIRAAICSPPTLVTLRSVLQFFSYPYFVSLPFSHFSAFSCATMQVMHHASCLPKAVTAGKRACPCVYSVCVRGNSANIYSYPRIICANNSSKYHNSHQWLRRATAEIADVALIFIRTTNGEVGWCSEQGLLLQFIQWPCYGHWISAGNRFDSENDAVLLLWSRYGVVRSPDVHDGFHVLYISATPQSGMDPFH
jgi:hypothetical protein